MEHLLKEALKTLCGVNQWSYAVFWKTGCQNPRLLFFEECYYEPRSYSRLAGTSENGNPDSIHLLLNKMMMDNNVLIVGEGLVGRAAFNGKHWWILPENFHRESHPPKVIEEVYQQFSAGMQAVAVIPILPHGVVQFGSHLKIVENMKFINDVVWLILQLGNMPGVFQSKDYAEHESAPRIGIPVLHGYSTQISASVSSTVEVKNEALPAYRVPGSNLSHLKTQDWCNEAETVQALEMESSPQNHFMNSVAKAEVISTNSDIWTNQCSSSNMNTNASFRDSVGHHIYKNSAKSGLDPFKKEMEQIISREGRVTSKSEHLHIDYDAVFNHPESGDDLFDILGTDFKRKLLKSYCNGHVSKGKSPFSELQSTSLENSESGIFSSTCSDHLLDAVVFKPLTSASQRVDDNVSCGATLTNVSSPSTTTRILCPGVPLSIHDHTKGDVCGIPEYLADASAMSSLASLRKGASREDSGTYSQCSSIYDSWPEYCPTVKHNNHTSTGFSAKSSKPNRKRLKPGENPRPRPKDRQMIQDRVKELREIVPNGAKCSIDALLERTIKHMLFLQSVTKHADKLKETVQSKIVGNRGGGATWAYEVGSQSMICPIVIENLNQPGQMLIEMLCHGRGLFLEIADIIRGLGLTILKGITETRNDNIWACFAVEANRDMTRMEIFLSLVGLLEQNSTEDPPQMNNISNTNAD